MTQQGIHDTQVVQKIFTGHKTSTTAMGWNPLAAKVVKSVGDDPTVPPNISQVVVTIDGYSDTSTFTAVYETKWLDADPGGATLGVPPVGTPCLIVFVRNSVNPWVLGFLGLSWPGVPS